MAAIGLVEFDIGMMLTEIAPDATHRTYRGMIGLSHKHIAKTEHAVHTLVGAQDGEEASIGGIAILMSPSHKEHRGGIGGIAAYRVDKTSRKRETLGLDLTLREGGVLALLLQHDDIPAALTDEVHRAVGTMLSKGTAARSVGLVGDIVADRLGDLLDERREVVGLGVAIADKKDTLRGGLCQQKCSKAKGKGKGKKFFHIRENINDYELIKMMIKKDVVYAET